MSNFRLAVEQLGEKPTQHRFEVGPGWWADRQPDTDRPTETVRSPFVFVLDAARVGGGILLEGRFEGEIEVECGRCTRRYPHALREGFRLMLEPATRDFEPVDPEGRQDLAEKGVWLGEDLEAGWFQGPLIRLDDYFGEIIALSMPLQPLCKEDCPGICPHCGVNRAETPCDCVDEQIESPFAVLARLKKS
ncbi:MAG TPA: DUF177 domain-containing protein [Deltaproteobacteria bacterium]|nr:DUF177 domain-containing protein [Deltaproteobacteria bacterium]